MAEDNNVWASPDSNTYKAVTTNNIDNTSTSDSSTEDTHTRLYEYIATTIELDEMSLPLHDDINSNSNIDASTGQHEQQDNTNSDPYQTAGNQSPSKTLSIGVTFPLLRINDHYYTDHEIQYFSLSCCGLIPQIEVRLSCCYNDIIKDNTIKDGDICSVFISPGHDSIKFYRGDFQITEARTNDLEQNKYTELVEIHFLGELFIPKLYDGSATFSYTGTSRDALIDAATKLGLGFFFSDAENTEDVQCWYCTSDGDQKETGEAPMIRYIKDVAAHSYKNFDSFFDCWIDPRYAITFVNVAQMLGNSGMDEEIDLAVFNSAMTMGKNRDAGNIEASASEKKAKTYPMPKLLNNLVDGQMAITAFTVISYKEMSDSFATKTLGMTNSNYYSMNNTGIQSVEEGQVTMEYSIPVNSDKLKNGFYIMGGPGKNLTYTQAETGSYPDQHKSVQGGQISDTMSDTDGAAMIQSGNNMLSSGNTNKFYETGEAHNKLNNAWLKKKYIRVTLSGVNMQLMRGEKIPMFLLDYQNPAINYMGAKTAEETLYKKISVNGCGWFIIRNIKWIYERNSLQNGTQWTTVLDVTRREWPIPGYIKNTSTDQVAEVTVTNNINDGTVQESTNASVDSSTGTSGTGTTNTQSENVTTNGLKDFMISIYNDIKQVASEQNKSLKLVSGRRWAADENDKRIDGKPTVYENGNWKFINANGDIVWYASSTSKHIYGEAFDIINGEGTTFKELGTLICTSAKIITNMLDHGVYMQIETTKDDLSSGLEHYHLGTVDSTNSESINGQKTFWNKLIEQRGSNTLSYNNKVYNLSQYT